MDSSVDGNDLYVAETLKVPLNQLIFDPDLDPEENEYADKQNAQLWNEKEYDYAPDALDHKRADHFVGTLLESINTFFLVGDGKISHILADILSLVIRTKGMSYAAFLCTQIQNEAVHAISYSRSARMIIGEEKLTDLINDVLKMRVIQEKISYLDPAENPYESFNDSSEDDTNILSIGRKFVRLACGEGIFFVTQFAIIRFFREINMYKVFCELNDHIFKDEMLHAAHKCMHARRTLKLEDREPAKEDIRTAYRLETNFLSYLLRNGVPMQYNISYDKLCAFAKIRCNEIGIACGLGAVFEDDNLEQIESTFPDWMKYSLGGTTKVNFFEIAVNSNYKKGTHDSGMKLREVTKEILEDVFS